jgi:hypothetical protein
VRVVYEAAYPDELAASMLREAGTTIARLDAQATP